jgi:membrane protease YdiL (CAAX protease family)
MGQAEMIQQMTDKEVKKALFLSQAIFFIIGMIASFFLFEQLTDWYNYFHFNPLHIFVYGVCTAVGLVMIEIILSVMLPEKAFDDGGINEKIFRNQKVGSIAQIAIVVAICEEILFRGVIQVGFGYIFASILFIIVHVRYLKKPVLFMLMVATSFWIGYLFLLTENLFVTIVFHFIVDFLLGCFVKYKK